MRKARLNAVIVSLLLIMSACGDPSGFKAQNVDMKLAEQPENTGGLKRVQIGGAKSPKVNQTPNFANKENSTGTDSSAESNDKEVKVHSVFAPSDLDYVNIPYTAAGNKEILTSMKTMLKNDHLDTDLSDAVKKVKVERMDNSKQNVTRTPDLLRITISLDEEFLSQDMTFLVEITDGNLKFEKLLPKDPVDSALYDYSLDLVCLNRDCQLIEIYLKKYIIGEKENYAGQAGIIYSYSENFIDVQRRRFKGGKVHPEISRLLLAEQQGKKAIKEDVVVAFGPSYTKVMVPDLDSSQPLLELETDRVQTNNHVTALPGVSVPNDYDVRGTLTGNDPTTSNIAVALTYPEKDESDENDVQIVLHDGSHPDQSSSEADINRELGRLTSNSTAIIPVPEDPSLDRVVAYTRRLLEIKNNSYVQKEIASWQQNTPRKAQRAANFFRYVQPANPYILKIATTRGTPTQVYYLMARESDYFTDPQNLYNGNVVNENEPGNTATGALQFVKRTGKRMASNLNKEYGTDLFKVFNFSWKNGRKHAHPQDFRRYLVPSLLAAATYFDYFAGLYPDHPELWVLAYYVGEGGLGARMECASKGQGRSCVKAIHRNSSKMSNSFKNRHLYFEMSFNQILSLNVLTPLEYDYLLETLALAIIGMEPEKYGFTPPEPNDDLEIPMDSLFLPGTSFETYFPEENLGV